MRNFTKNNGGFTVMEIVVALGIFGIAATVALGIYVQANKAQKKVSNSQKVSTEIRFVMEVISKEIRLGTVDYSFYPKQSPTSVQSILALRDSTGLAKCFKRIDVGNRGVVQAYIGVNTSDSCQPASGNWVDISSSNISVQTLNFFIFPNIATTTQQNLVTISMGVKNLISDPALQSVSRFQTSISTRSYKY